MTTEAAVAKRIVERDGQYCVQSEDGTRNFGCYTDRGRAERRLAQVEHFSQKSMFTTGDLASGGLRSPEQGVPTKGRKLRRALQPPFSATVDVMKNGALSMRHVMYGETQAAADALVKAHAKYDAALAAAIKGEAFGGGAIVRRRARVAKALPLAGRCAVVLMLPPDLQRRLALPGGERPESLHLTLGYFGRVEEMAPGALARLVQCIEDVALDQDYVSGVLAGTGRFKANPQTDGLEVFYLSYDSPDLQALYSELCHECEEAEVPVRHDHGFTPHITLAYLPPDAPDPAIVPLPEAPLVFTGITLMVEDWFYFFPFGGRALAEVTAPSIEDTLRATYLRHLAETGFEAKAADRDIEGEQVGDDLYRVSDAWGEWYFQGDAKEMRWVAQKMPAVKAYAVNPTIEALDGWGAQVKAIGLETAAWDAALTDALTPRVEKAFAAILKADAAQRYTLGVAYPARALDAHKDFMSEAELEKAAWAALHKGLRLGLMHKRGTDGAGQVVESYIYRGPRWEIDGQVIEPGDWMVGAIWREDVWAAIQRGDLTGYSMQGFARKQAGRAPEARK